MTDPTIKHVSINKEVGGVGQWDAEDVAKLIPEEMEATDVAETSPRPNLNKTDKSADADEE